jgi:hypothetical protein
MSKIMIAIDPPLVCQYLPECTNRASQALIWTNELQPIRWVMMPVCVHCLSAAKVMYSPSIVSNNPNYVNSGAKNVQKV